MSTQPDDDAIALLLDLGSALHVTSLPADLADERLRDAAKALGLDAEFFSLQTFLAIDARRTAGPARTEFRRIPFDTHWNLTRSDAVIELTQAIAERRLDVPAARAELVRITTQRPRYGAWWISLGYAVYGGVVAARVGGGWRELAAAMVISVVAGLVHQGTTKNNEVDLQKSFIGALLGSLVGIALAFVLPPFDFGRALFGGVVMLVPAMVLTVGIHELANEAVESGTIRLAYGLLRFALMATGISAAFLLAHLFHVWPAYVTAKPLPHLVVLGLVALGGLALVPILQGRPRDVIWIVAAAVLAYGTHELTKVGVGPQGAPMIAAFVLGVAAYLQARIPGHVAFTMLVPGLLQLAPGFVGTEAVIGQLREGGGTGSSATFFAAIIVAVQLGIGLLAASLIFRRRKVRPEGEPAASRP